MPTSAAETLLIECINKTVYVKHGLRMMVPMSVVAHQHNVLAWVHPYIRHPYRDCRVCSLPLHVRLCPSPSVLLYLCDTASVG
jgi:hypothetical protein